ncbi:unnamed protein product [Oppiella nova]|uniref:Uncharacterized protein n=1 Tax=Oppiella nova TaxID=334625 RepID=A0A7R9QSB8_9ACAR|nr:unnamed protein product [Oppiella nova]CAG2172570.1 unnamed protein product [Oppiella nova]
MFVVKRYKEPEIRTTESIDYNLEATKSVQLEPGALQILEPSRKTKIIIVALIALSLNSYSGFEMTYFQNSSTYYQYLPIRISAQKAADIYTLMTSTYTAGRLFAAYISSKLKPETMITYHSIILIISIAILHFGSSSEILIWIGNGLIDIYKNT